MPKQVILCMFSGGLDSTGVLHRLLNGAEYQDYEILLHHIHIRNRENRSRAEAFAVQKILTYYREHADRAFLYTESVFDTNGFAPLKSTRFPFDMDVCAFIAANVCLANKNVAHVAMGRTKTDVKSTDESFQKRMDRAQSIYKATLMHSNIDVPEYTFPVVDFTKREIWQMLSPEVRNASWWCRRPIYDQVGNPRTCDSCITCKEMNEILVTEE